MLKGPRSPSTLNHITDFLGILQTFATGLLIKFIRDRFSSVVLTTDLDANDKLYQKLETLGFKKNDKYFPIGIDKDGKRDIEGLLPDELLRTVRFENNHLVDKLGDADAKVRKNTKDGLKEKYLEKFKSEATVDNGYFDEFYKITKKLNKALSSK